MDSIKALASTVVDLHLTSERQQTGGQRRPPERTRRTKFTITVELLKDYPYPSQPVIYQFTSRGQGVTSQGALYSVVA